MRLGTLFSVVLLSTNLAVIRAEEAPLEDSPVFESPADIPSRYFARAPETRFVRMSPNGEHFLTVSPVGVNQRIRVHAFDESAGRRLFSGSIPTKFLDAVYWGNDERVLIEISTWGFKDRRWGRRTVISAAEIDSQEVEVVWRGFARTEDALSRSAIIHLLPDESDHILVRYSEDEKSYPGVYRLDIYSGETTKLIEGQQNIDSWLASNDGEILLGYGRDENDIYLSSRLSGSNSWAKAELKDYPAPWRLNPIAINSAKTHAYIIRDEPTGPDSLWLYDLNKGEFSEKIYQHEVYDVSALLINDVTGDLAGYVITDDQYRYHYINDNDKLTQLRIDKALPNAVNRIRQFSPNGRYFLVYSSSDTNPGAYYRLDMEENNLMLFGKVNSKLDPELLAPTQAFKFSARDGLELDGYMTLPKKAAGLLPLVVMPHGGPNARDSIDYDFVEQFLVSRGYATLKMNYRGSAGYGREFEEMGHGQWGKAVQNDMLDAIDYLVAEGIADPERVCIYGASFGGYMALLETYRDKPVVKCAVAFAPITDLKLHRRLVSSDVGKWLIDKLYGPLSARELKEIDPIRNVSSVSVPILLIHGDEDRRVSVDHSRRLDKALRRKKKQYEYIEIEGEGHSFSLGTTRNRLLKEVEEFLEAHIGG